MSIALYFGTAGAISALLSIGLATCICLLHRRRTTVAIVASTLLGGVGLIFALLMFATYNPWLLGFWIVGAIAVAYWYVFKWRRTTLLAFLMVAALVIHTIPAYVAYSSARSHHDLAAKYPFESMANRVPQPKRTGHEPVKLSESARANMARFEEFVDIEVESPEVQNRVHLLRQLHEDGVDTFVRSAGFGVLRMRRATDENLKSYFTAEKEIPQSGLPFLSNATEAELEKGPSLIPDSLHSMHKSGVIDFINLRGFGLVQSREKVAGFREHRISMLPSAGEVKVRAVELVGLLINEEPVVYISDKLPNMATARTAPKRALNAFESAGLEKLRDGEDLFVRETKEGTRMLGAIRSVEQCVKCHGGERGDLLGAFSYSLETVAK